MIFAMHGAVEVVLQERFGCRGLVSAERFRRYLRHRAPFVSLNAAAQGKGDALTIDDATQAAAEAVEIALEAGHEVTWFVNGHHVTSGLPYATCVLDTWLDTLADDYVEVLGERYPCATWQERVRVRRVLKAQLVRAGSLAEVERLLAPFEGGPLPLPRRTVVLGQVERAARFGATIANHGWTHLAPAARQADELRVDIDRGRAFVESVGGDGAPYAVPFGASLPPYPVRLTAGDAWYLLTGLLQPGHVGPSIINRVDLERSKEWA